MLNGWRVKMFKLNSNEVIDVPEKMNANLVIHVIPVLKSLIDYTSGEALCYSWDIQTN